MNRENISKIGVIGAGSWGTTLANMLAVKGLEVDLWVKEKEALNQIRDERENKIFLPGVKLDSRLRPVESFEEALYNKQLLLMVVPSHVFRVVLTDMKPYINREMLFMAATKGIENKTLMTMSQIVEDVLSKDYLDKFLCLSGPSFAKEVCKKLPTAVTIAGSRMESARRLQQVFHTEYFRVYVSQDLMGVQLGGALKNVIAIAAGVSDGLNFGHNARAALITRGLAEITRLGVAMGANPLTFAGLAGIGDLVLTCTGDLSRNRTVGLKMGKGVSVMDITSGMNMVAEGIKTARSVYELAVKMGVDMPIATQVYQLIYESKDPKTAVKELMARELKEELEY